METPIAAAPSPAPAAPEPLDAAYCGPEPDFTEISAMCVETGFPH